MMRQTAASRAPEWAERLLYKVLADERYREGVQRQWPIERPFGVELIWRVRENKTLSSGVCMGDGSRRIVVRAGINQRDQRHTLLHEIGHLLTPGQRHNERFYARAFTLFDRYAYENFGYAVQREMRYQPTGARAGLGLFMESGKANRSLAVMGFPR